MNGRGKTNTPGRSLAEARSATPLPAYRRDATGRPESIPRITLTLREVVASTGIPYQTLLDAIKRAEIATIVYGKGVYRKRYLILHEDLLAWLHAKRVPVREKQ